MKRLVVFSLFLAGFITGVHGAVPQQRRGAAMSPSSGSSASGGAPTVAARAATNRAVRGATPTTSGSAAVSARSATAPRAVPRATSTSSAPNTTVSARAASMQKVINTGTKVAAATENTVVSEACRKKYEGCMDAFCMMDNANGGRCLCSDRNAELNNILAEIEKLDQQSYQMATVGVERLEMGESADEVIQQANAIAQNFMDTKGEETRKTRELNLETWNLADNFSDANIWDDQDQTRSAIDTSTGDALHAEAVKLCVPQMPECANQMQMLQLMYGQKIKSDCSAYENSLKQQKNASAQKLQTAERALRDAALDQYRNSNKYDLGQCTIKFKECMQTTAGCGDDFSKCAGLVAMDRMNNKNTNKHQIKGDVTTIEIAALTYDTLLGKQPLCMSVTNQCVRVRDKVWDAFLREVAPQLKSAEMIAESDMRTSCISNISDCFHKACKDKMDPKDPDGSYNLCLTNPDMVASLCKIQVEPCENSIPGIMDYVGARLEAMRIDSCTTDVKKCLQAEDVCGKDYTQCIGLDMATIQSLCPKEKLVGCHEKGSNGLQVNEDYKKLLYGIFLNIDNNLVAECQKLADVKMSELCGNTETCDDGFAEDNVIGTESLISYTDGKNYVIDGMMSYANVKLQKIGNGLDVNSTTGTDGQTIKLGVYELNVDKYIDGISGEKSTYSQSTKDRIENAMKSTANKINQKIAILTSDPKISMCVFGRDISQIKSDGTTTKARFPHLLDSHIMAIISSGMDRAGVNYSNKLNEMIGAAVENQSDDIKTALCAAMAMNPGETDLNAFGDIITGDSKVGDNGTMTIAGVDKSNLLKVAASGKGEWVLTDTGNEAGNMIGRIVKSAVYAASKNTCTLTTTVEMCDEMEFVYDETSLNIRKAKRGVSLSFDSDSGNNYAGSSSSTAGSNSNSSTGSYDSSSSNNIKLNTKKVKDLSIETKQFRGQACKKFAEPQTTSQSIKM